jgi:nicotinamidase-related amidase
MLKTDDSAFVLIDVQGKLAQLMHEKDSLFSSLVKLIKGITILDIPVIWMEQIPEKMGPTIPELSDLLDDLSPISKTAFSCAGHQGFLDQLKALGRSNIILAGIETHVCMYQTARDLRDADYHVEVVADATSSRTASNREIGLQRIRECGAHLTSVEMLLMELLSDASDPRFKEVLKVIK